MIDQRTRGDLVRAGATMVAVLGALGTALLLRDAAGLSAQIVVLAVVLAMTLSRVSHEGTAERVLVAVELPFVAVAAGGVGWLIVHEPWVGQPLVVVGLSVGILARRFGPALRRTGRLVTLPFVGLLVTPVPVRPDDHPSSILWSAAAAVIALAWAMGASAVADRFSAPTAAPTSAPTAAPTAPARPSRRRLDAPTRMALQMAIGVGLAFVAGHLLFGDRWAWTVLSAFLVASGNRGRGDVVHKAGLRLVGAGVGTVGATLVGGSLPTGNRLALVALFAVMAVALVLRGRSYAFWAAGVTAMVALLHAYYGESGSTALTERLLGVIVGSAIGVASAWFVFPVRTRDVLRRRIADCLAALTDDLADDAIPAAARFPSAVALLDQLQPTLRAHHRTLHRRTATGGAHPLAAIVALHEFDSLPGDPTQRRRLRGDVVHVRRSMVGRAEGNRTLPPALDTVFEVLQR